MSEIKLTPAQSEIIRHRLEVPEAIEEVLTDTNPGRWEQGRVEEMAWEMCREVESSDTIKLGGLYSESTLSPGDVNLRREIACEAMNGSTYWRVAESWGDADELQLSRIKRSLEAIQAKFKSHGLSVDVVDW